MEIRYINTLSSFVTALVIVALTVLPFSGTASTARAAAGDISRLSVSSNGDQANGFSHSADVSADGRFVAFRSDASNLVTGDTNANEDIFLRDRQTGQTTRISISSAGAEANGGSYYPRSQMMAALSPSIQMPPIW